MSRLWEHDRGKPSICWQVRPEPLCLVDIGKCRVSIHKLLSEIGPIKRLTPCKCLYRVSVHPFCYSGYSIIRISKERHGRFTDNVYPAGDITVVKEPFV